MEAERTRSEKESAGDDFKLLVSQADIGSSPARQSSASHTMSPLFAISPPSILLHLPLRCSNSGCEALCLSPSHSCQGYCIYISFLSFSHSLEKNPLSLSFTHSVFLPTLFFSGYVFPSSPFVSLFPSIPYSCLLP